jgi:hypothetical protein
MENFQFLPATKADFHKFCSFLCDILLQTALYTTPKYFIHPQYSVIRAALGCVRG